MIEVDTQPPANNRKPGGTNAKLLSREASRTDEIYARKHQSIPQATGSNYSILKGGIMRGDELRAYQ